ncbi:hypothetical protein [Silvimonas sp.]|uniref:hypothetical protein n=1 Tax=Silvimonas sp. TaxID=2650811 RepID=UPI00284DE793|nr:hypothetical protein [Silvimonas sp.]MDR3428195.1 hypothetical protein [Silvimonas sp.]
MTSTPLLPELETGETGSLQRYLDTLEGALYYALLKKGSALTANHDTWQLAFDALSKAATGKQHADIAIAQHYLVVAINETRQARTWPKPYRVFLRE